MEDYESNRACSCLRCCAHGLMGPVVLITLGVLFLLDEFNVVAVERSWPLLLIALGVMILLRHNAPMEGHVPPSAPTLPSSSAGPSGGDAAPPAIDNRQVPNA